MAQRDFVSQCWTTTGRVAIDRVLSSCLYHRKQNQRVKPELLDTVLYCTSYTLRQHLNSDLFSGQRCLKMAPRLSEEQFAGHVPERNATSPLVSPTKKKKMMSQRMFVVTFERKGLQEFGEISGGKVGGVARFEGLEATEQMYHYVPATCQTDLIYLFLL